MFLKSIGIPAVMAGALCLTAQTALAECKPSLTQAGEAAVSRTLVAFPTSFWAWKKAAREKYGEAFDNWSSASNRRIDCVQESVAGAKRWICTRTAEPCDRAEKSAKIPRIEASRLQRGDKGEQVERLQQWLNLHGYAIEVDGNFGSGTVRAVRDFQSREGIKVDGVVGRETQERLQA